MSPQSKTKHTMRRPMEKAATASQIGLLFHLHSELGKPVESVPGTKAAAKAAIESAQRQLATSPPRPFEATSPTAPQLHDLKVYCNRLGQTFAEPRTSAQANRELTVLREEWTDLQWDRKQAMG